ncbi:CpsD/CapB family tyrosine-protein kinase [Actinoplanes sp. NEAU-A12]|uniref:CpsD/CapB family tyrosine-protein kinase n=1 Tax=Actinoplanes sandaracinus TaxID=3045177 RepID=A0ABT6WMN6_9ACTN|nr:CpsD/CapB family tyrosine-protein kinase [Actinoplanes sandaracinus]MDI6100951.1 CpsD/CapB family tyrosine-protein kinase [Actinoplanes sandaracinus]
MTTYGRSARLLRRYGPWTLVVTTAAIAAAYGLHRSAPPRYVSEATVLVESRTDRTVPATAPDIGTEREVALSNAVVQPAAVAAGFSAGDFRENLTVDVVPGTHVLRIAYTGPDRFSAQIRTRALVEAYAGFRTNGPATVRVLTGPALPVEPVTRPLALDLAAGAAAGLLFGAGTAVLRARTRGRIRGRDDFARLTGTPVLATVPRHRRPSGTGDGVPVVVLRAPGSPAAESYRYLRSRLQPSLRSTGTTTILVTSPGDRQGRTTTAANLAVTLAQAGRSVVLVDADLRNPRMHHLFQVPGDHGLTTLLDGDATVSEVLEETSVSRLRVVPAGHRDGDHVDLFDSGQLARVIRALHKHADVVILDSAAVLSASDAIVLAALADQVLLVGDFARTSRESVRRALAELAEVADGNVSPVLVNVPKSAGALVPRPRTLLAPVLASTPPARDRLYSDADDVAPPGMTAHAYVDDEDEDDPLADYYARTATIAVPVIYGSARNATVYASATATTTAEPEEADEAREQTPDETVDEAPDETVDEAVDETPDETVDEAETAEKQKA